MCQSLQLENKNKNKRAVGEKRPLVGSRDQAPERSFLKAKTSLRSRRLRLPANILKMGCFQKPPPTHTHTHTLIALGCAHSSLLVNTAVVIVIFPEALAITPALTIWQLMGGKNGVGRVKGTAVS